jgi:hypothetical protein
MADSIGAASLVGPLLGGAALLYVAACILRGEPLDPLHPFDMEELRTNAAHRWNDIVYKENYQPLQWEAEAPGLQVFYMQSDPNGNAVPPADTGHSFSPGFHPGLSRTHLEHNEASKPITYSVINAHKKRVSQTKPGYETHRSRRDVIRYGGM